MRVGTYAWTPPNNMPHDVICGQTCGGILSDENEAKALERDLRAATVVWRG
jgi:hypothetical protein